METVDRKFKIKATCVAHDHVYTEQDSILFLAKDPAVPPTLEFYRRECQRLGADERQIKCIDLLIERVKKFQSENYDKVKVGDVDQGKEEEIVNRPNE